MNKYIKFIEKFRKILFILLVIINITALIGITKLRINTNFDIFSAKESIYRERLEEIDKYFDNSDQLIILIENDELNMDVMHEWHEFQKHLGDNVNTLFVKGPAPKEITMGNVSISIVDLDVTKLTMLKNYYSRLDTFSPLIVDGEYTYGVFTLFINDEFGKSDINDIEDYLDGVGVKYYISGDTYNEIKILDYILTILSYLPPLALLLILFIFRTQMKSFKATILSVIPAGIGALWTMGLIGWLGNEVSIITVISPIFTIVIGSADGLHFVSHIQDSRSEGLGKIESIVSTLKMVGIPMIITTVTSVAGFLSLLVMNTESIYDFALFSSIGITFAGIATWFILPIILVGDTDLKIKSNVSDKFSFIYSWMRNTWGKASIIIVLLLVVGSVVSLRYINNEFNMLMVYKDNVEVSKSYDKIMDINGGSIPLYAYISLDEDPITIESSGLVYDLIDELEKDDNVIKVNSIYHYISILNSMMNNSSIEYPESNIIANQIYMMASTKDENIINGMINREESMVKLLIFPKDLNNDTLDNIESIINKYDTLDAKVTGVQFLMKDLNDDMFSNVVNSIILALFLVFMMLYISLRNIKVAFYSVLPIISTTLIVFGFLGISGIPLNIVTVIIFSISIGVGIDYAVHFSSVWMTYFKENNNKVESTNKAFKYTSRPIITNGFGIAIGLSALLLSPLMIHTYVSSLMWVSMIVSVFLSLSLLPTLLMGRNKGIIKEEEV